MKWLLVVAALALCSCEKEAPPKHIEIALSAYDGGMGFGPQVELDITMDRSRNIRCVEKRDDRVVRNVKGQATPAQLQEIWRAVRKADFFDGAELGAVISDVGPTELTIKTDTESRTRLHQPGFDVHGEAGESLDTVFQLIEELCPDS